MDVKTLSLGVLMKHPMSGYEVKKELERSFRHFVSAGYGSIYPALAELAAGGLVSMASVEQDKRPDKKIYAITPAGREKFVHDLMNTQARHRVRSEFLVLMYFAHLLPVGKADASLQEMIEFWERTLREDIETFEQDYAREQGQPLEPGMSFALGFGRAMVNCALTYVEEQRQPLLDALAEREPGGRAAAE